MNLQIISVGRVKSPWIKQGIEHYVKLLSRYAQTTLVSVKEADSSSLSPEKVQVEEGKRLSERLDQHALRFVLDETGRQFTSRQLADYLKKSLTRYPSFQFVIGGAFGLSDDLKRRGNVNLSLSRMTLPHELTLVVLLEQLYRALSINRGSKYHK